ncbi:hypothetical protein D1227_15095 [Henriciella mobilis]|uniref:hypothetical protein n=1 Tax=Henriciella mobilis TaxID=2305467 RepID=UPI000E668343|nr:hypothetical protein [Henriciella mobilis]RIJ14446.1 hypothetical protein D1231_16945 [Henriciella mobilis]RIJ19726.1 hypothetical protein D1227_15095 [Henriciella mobilis]
MKRFIVPMLIFSFIVSAISFAKGGYLSASIGGALTLILAIAWVVLGSYGEALPKGENRPNSDPTNFGGGF